MVAVGSDIKGWARVEGRLDVRNLFMSLVVYSLTYRFI